MTNEEIKQVLIDKGVSHLYHANTVGTTVTFLRNGGLFSRGAVEDNGLYQTRQVTDESDKGFKIYYDIFFDSVDIHERANNLNDYGPVTFVYSLDLIDKLPRNSIKITKINPIRWENSMSEEEKYDGFYAVITNLEGEVGEILKINRQRWEIEENFRIMKTDFSARPVYLQDENRIKAHFLICFLALTLYRFLEKKLDYKYTCGELLDTLKAINFAEIQEQGFIPLYRRELITDDLHEVCGFRTDYQFITKSDMRTIQKKSKGKE